MVDPLDGTSNYVHGFPAWCVSIALARGDEILVGTVYDPVRDECFTAQLGAGAAIGSSSTRGVQEAWTVTDGRNIKTIAVNIQIPRRTNTLVYSMVIPCRD